MEELQLPMDQALPTLDADALMRFQRLQTAAFNASSPDRQTYPFGVC